jgi:hypothetical protein
MDAPFNCSNAQCVERREEVVRLRMALGIAQLVNAAAVVAFLLYLTAKLW